jgi:hypothetical protein
MKDVFLTIYSLRRRLVAIFMLGVVVNYFQTQPLAVYGIMVCFYLIDKFPESLSNIQQNRYGERTAVIADMKNCHNKKSSLLDRFKQFIIDVYNKATSFFQNLFVRHNKQYDNYRVNKQPRFSHLSQAMRRYLHGTIKKIFWLLKICAILIIILTIIIYILERWSFLD